VSSRPGEKKVHEATEVPRERKFLGGTPSTPESHRVFTEDDEYLLRSEFRKLRGQLKEARSIIRELTTRWDQELYELETLVRMSERANGTARHQIKDAKLENTTELTYHHHRLTAPEAAFKSLDLRHCGGSWQRKTPISKNSRRP